MERKFLREFGLINAPLAVTIAILFRELCQGVLETGDSFVLPQEYTESDVKAFVSDALAGTYQSVPLSSKVGDVLQFGKFIKFELDAVGKIEVPVKNAFDILFAESGNKRLPDMKPNPTIGTNSKQTLHNDFVNWLKEKNLQWNDVSQTYGNKFVRVVVDTFWMVDCHRTLSQQNCTIPFEEFSGYNVPRQHKMAPKALCCEDLQHAAQSFFLFCLR